MLKDDDFSKKANVDRYGRKIDKSAGRKDLERFYRVGDDDEEDRDVEKSEADNDDEVRKELARVDRKYDPAREGGFSESSSDEESSDEEEDEELDVEEEDILGDASQEVPTGEVTARLAAVNMDWDHIRAVDLLAVASSFAPADGKIVKVSVYSSEYGRAQIEREELEGPPAELFEKVISSKSTPLDITDEDEDEDETEERIKKSLLGEDKGDEYSSTTLRNYQLSRLRYYYAIITCSSPYAAKALYDAMDNREYLTTANFFDLRFVPDETTFEEAPRDEATKVPQGYQPNEFTTDALTHSKVRLTWDADDTQRKEAQKRAFSRGEVEENDLKAYIGTDSSTDEDEEPVELGRNGADGELESGTTSERKNKGDEKRQRMRALLGLSEGPAKTKKRNDDVPVGDLQITFTSGLSASNKKGSVFQNQRPTEESTREKYMRKEKERKERRRERAKASREGQLQQEDDEPLNLNSGSENEAEVDPGRRTTENVTDSQDDPFNDPFFTDPKASAKAENVARKAAAKKKREERDAEEAATASKRAELELLMVDDKSTDGGTLKHFDMNEIEKAEKADKKKRKGKKGKKDAQAPPVASTNDFQMNVQDPRFAKLYESHEFAIDPTNPRFKGTEGMKKLLEEGRRKRKDDRDTEKPKKRARMEHDAIDTGVAQNRDDLQRLVAKVKGKTKR